MIQEKTIALRYKPTPRQREAHLTLADELLYGGAMGGAKTVWLCHAMYNAMQKFPGNRGFIGRKISKHFKATTLLVWREWIPRELYIENKSAQTFTFPNGSMCMYGGVHSDQDEVNWMLSGEFGAIAIDQAEEMTLDEYSNLLTRKRYFIPGYGHPPFRVYLTANPRAGWLKQRFVGPTPEPGTAFVRALPTDNPHLPPSYVNDLRRLYRHRPELLRAYVEGLWEDIAGFDIVIQEKWVTAAYDRRASYPFTKRYTTCDPAGMGDDETVIYNWENARIVDEMIYGQVNEMATAGNIRAMSLKNRSTDIFVENDGLGSPINSRLEQLLDPRDEMLLHRVQMGGAPTLEDSPYWNMRAEVWWTAGQMLYDGGPCLPKDESLFNDLTVVKYETKPGGTILIQDKADIKKELGRSPNKGDACVLGLWALEHARTSNEIARARSDDALTSSQRWQREREMEQSGFGHDVPTDTEGAYGG